MGAGSNSIIYDDFEWRQIWVSRLLYTYKSNISKTVRFRDNVTKERYRIGNHTRSTEWYHFQWSWVTSDPDFKVTTFFEVEYQKKRHVLKTKLLLHKRKVYLTYGMYYVWWPWLTSKRVARVCQHQLSFLCILSWYCCMAPLSLVKWRLTNASDWLIDWLIDSCLVVSEICGNINRKCQYLNVGI